jgi:rhamnose transport system ATP-binding protein
MIPAIELRAIAKRFGTVEVLSGVDLSLHAGRVHALAGENGAGKSTIVKILGGIHQPDSGCILKDGQEIVIVNAANAQRHGIAVVHQHPALFPDLSVAENIFVGRQPRRSGRIDWPAMVNRARELLASLRVGIDPLAPVMTLSIAERQAIEIVKALSIDARVLVLDEPTSALSGPEVDRLFEIVAHLQRQGVAILFISHFLDEIVGYSDDVTVLRSGRRVVTAPAAELTAEQIVRHMIGAELKTFFAKEDATIGAPVISVRGLSGADFIDDVSFEVRSGEILGFFGLVGAGRSEVAQMLFGLTRPDSGEIVIGERRAQPGSPAEAMGLGVAFVPEDRHRQGLVLPFPIRANETLPILRRLSSRLGLVDRRAEARIAAGFTARMQVRATGIEQATSALSGGNQQKVLLAKWLMPSPKLLILDEPTRGIDVGAKSEIHRTISQLAAQGMAIILISDDANELIGMADRIAVFRGGRISAQFARGAFDREALMLAAAHARRAADEPPPPRAARAGS